MDSAISKIVTGIDFAIRTGAVPTSTVTSLLNVEPTRAFDQGDVYVGRERLGTTFHEVERARPWGVWHFCSSCFINTNSIEEHALFILAKFEPLRDAIQTLIDGQQCAVVITIWYVGRDGFFVSSATVARLASICEQIGITCWDHGDEE
ncbi:MAG: DUF4279 domain-containing protein [Singulisphaera sp.]